MAIERSETVSCLSLTTTDSSPQSTHPPYSPAANSPCHCKPPRNFPHPSTPVDAEASPPALAATHSAGPAAGESRSCSLHIEPALPPPASAPRCHRRSRKPAPPAAPSVAVPVRSSLQTIQSVR